MQAPASARCVALAPLVARNRCLLLQCVAAPLPETLAGSRHPRCPTPPCSPACVHRVASEGVRKREGARSARVPSRPCLSRPQACRGAGRPGGAQTTPSTSERPPTLAGTPSRFGPQTAACVAGGKGGEAERRAAALHWGAPAPRPAHACCMQGTPLAGAGDRLAAASWRGGAPRTGWSQPPARRAPAPSCAERSQLVGCGLAAALAPPSGATAHRMERTGAGKSRDRSARLMQTWPSYGSSTRRPWLSGSTE